MADSGYNLLFSCNVIKIFCHKQLFRFSQFENITVITYILLYTYILSKCIQGANGDSNLDNTCKFELLFIYFVNKTFIEIHFCNKKIIIIISINVEVDHKCYSTQITTILANIIDFQILNPLDLAYIVDYRIM